MSEQKPTGIAASLVAAMAEIEAVTKEGKNTIQNYGYVRAADVANEVRKVLVKHGIAFGFSVIEEERWMTDRFDRQGTVIGHMNYVRIVAEAEFEDAATGQIRKRRAPGWGQDVGEKAIYKAMTGALKYALRMNFIIPDESDPENEQEQRTTPAEVSAISHNPPQSSQSVPQSQGSKTVIENAKARVAASVAQQQAEQGHFAVYEDRVECIIKAVTEKESKKGTYLLVTFNGRVDGFNYAAVWHKTLNEALLGAVNKSAVLKLSKKMTDDGKAVKFLNVEDVFAIDGVQYKKGQPDVLLTQLTKSVEAVDNDIPF